PQDFDVDGQPTDDPAAAVLHPIERYSGLLAGLQAEQQELDPGARVRVVVIDGAAIDGSLHYADADDPVHQDSFGIGPGCTSSGEIQAMPPVRMRDVALASGGTVGSICASDYSQLLRDAVTPFLAGCG
ncbi:MAG TPA: hypothetical protein VK034_24440, partial [Enhygromyxa sp.]|nr:hypothetical protein [Enhygromyxa sp.]